ncbi:ZIP zinc transporter [Candidatus Roizmanbacteria bacterium CG11_big_fil_rev_8_21_14_0_20_36_8]|uniref:ZIP zinc transporter n=2 Tax=Candidatus Roizmaniibacteriota TaxID=1752723 RepID=A0A2M6IVD7_9BACT|nr:MAG: ZIP zinc transporter [Candidatus Roizmanbacteria bacterium CG11_big_fil_rev_8_21_14_0_20_36_8]PIZ64482.1 MAG: ZIP zinc transporter [Candidatus Roizmanbacteria bacterium CG_4_10_14_0_2_um_filter_36_9]
MTLLIIITLTVAISLLSFVGIFLTKASMFSKRKFSHISVSFAAGVLIAAAFIQILPEAFHTTDDQDTLLFATLCGLVIGFLMERSLLWYHHHHENTHNLHPTALLVLFGDGVHNFIDGIAIAATTLINPALGLTTTIAIAAHEIPQEFADYMILRNKGMSKNKALFLNFISALTAVVGGILGYFLLQQVESMIPLALGVTAGLFIYIGAADLIPELHEESDKNNAIQQTVPLLLGILIIFLLSRFLSH